MAAIVISPDLSVMIRTATEKVPELKKMFVISELLLRKLPEGARPPATSRASADVLGIDVDVGVYEFPDADAAAEAWKGLVAAFEGRGMTVCAALADTEAFQAPAVVLKEPVVEERFIDDEGDRDGFCAAHRATIRVDCEVIGRFSRATGYAVRYCMGRYVTQPPIPFEEGAINVHLGARAPGNYRSFSLKVREIFGCKAWSDGEERMVHGPVQWRGRLISTDGIPVFQVIGNNYYQTVLIHSDNSNGFDRTKLWEKMMVLVARDLAAAHPADPAPATSEDIETGVRGMAGQRADALRDALRTLEFEIGDLQQKFAQKLRERDDKISLLKTLQRETADVASRCEEDFARLRATEGVAAVRIDAEDGLLVETGPIALERDGRRYDLGPFRIHIGADGAIAVWSETPRHPKGHHHPHIDRVSLECFGNITLAVTKLASGYRFADAVEIILRWLRSYRPETTLIPLEEFPSEPIPKTKGTARGKRDATELLAAAQAAGSESPQARDPDRSRGGRKRGRVRDRQDGGAEARRLGRR
jgi:hypothetical protein